MWRKWVCHLCELISTPSVFQRFFCESETRNNARCASLIVKKKKRRPRWRLPVSIPFLTSVFLSTFVFPHVLFTFYKHTLSYLKGVSFVSLLFGCCFPSLRIAHYFLF